MLSEDHDVGAAMPGRPTREDRRQHSGTLAERQKPEDDEASGLIASWVQAVTAERSA